MLIKTRMDEIFVQCAFADAGDKTFPDAGTAARTERMGFLVPVIEAADNENLFGVGRPHREIDPFYAVPNQSTGAEFLVGARVASLVE